jgi:hypothetical protein
MTGPVAKDLLRGAGGLLSEVTAGRALFRSWLALSLLMILSSAVYGAVLGMWQGPKLAFYVSLKLPLVLLLTSALTVPFSWSGAAVLGLPLRLGQVAGGGMFLWLALFALVSLQVATFVRPVLWSDPGQPLFVNGKMFFLEHFGTVLDHDEAARHPKGAQPGR